MYKKFTFFNYSRDKSTLFLCMAIVFSLSAILAFHKPTMASVAVTVNQVPGAEGSISGFVYDGNEDTDLVGATVTIDGNGFTDSTVTDADGYFEFTGLGAGEYIITFTKTGYKTQTVVILLHENEEGDVEVILEKEHTAGMIYGNITDVKGTPVEKAKVKLRKLGGKDTKPATTSSDGEGYYAFGELESGNYLIIVTKKGYKRKSLKVILSEGEQKELSFELDKKRKS